MNNVEYICGAGSSFNDVDIIKEMYDQGMRVVRFNLSYPLDYFDVDEVLEKVKLANQKYNIDIKIMFDLAGPELRVSSSKTISFNEGDNLIISKSGDFTIDKDIFYSIVEEDDEIVIGDSESTLKVIDNKDNIVKCVALDDGFVKYNNSVYCERVYKKLPFMSEKDEHNMDIVNHIDCDYLAISHVRYKKDVDLIKSRLINKDVKIISKIENGKGLSHIDDIVESSDGIMIARGDLSKIVPIEEMGHNMKMISKKALESNKIIISATGYLASMADSEIPSVEEVIDLYHAYELGIRMIMFTGEIALAQDPVNLLKTANKIYKSYLKK